MGQVIQIHIQDVFRFRDGRTVLSGLVEGDVNFIRRGRFGVWVDGELCGELEVEGEMIGSYSSPPPRGGRPRSLSTKDPIHLDPATIAERSVLLKPSRKGDSAMHRHLLGLESPPPDLIADTMTLGPILPEGWDGDAWERPGGGSYFLRAWNKESGRVAYGRGPTYAEARANLLADLSGGTRRVEVSTSKAAPA